MFYRCLLMYSQCDQHYILNIWIKVFLNLHLNIDGTIFYCFIAHGWKPIANIWWELYEAFDSHSQSINPIDSCSACIYAMTLQWRHNDHGASQITSLALFTQPFIQTHIKENIKAPRHWPLCGEFTGTGEFPAQKASYAENVSIWWRHHG